jgi:hypothetical protein
LLRQIDACARDRADVDDRQLAIPQPPSTFASDVGDGGGLATNSAATIPSFTINAVTSSCPAPATDRLLVSRPQGLQCDIGADQPGPALDVDARIATTKYDALTAGPVDPPAARVTAPAIEACIRTLLP